MLCRENKIPGCSAAGSAPALGACTALGSVRFLKFPNRALYLAFGALGFPEKPLKNQL